MQAIVPWGIWGAIALAVLGIVLILIFGVMSLIRGKTRLLSIAIMAVPAIVLILLALVGMTWSQAAIWAAIIMFGLGLLGLLLGGASGLVRG